jgi:ribosomal-protein-alanine N-acetyltransferase
MPPHMPDQIQTDRLVLRPFALSDVDAVFVVAGDSEWARFLPLPRPYLRSHAEQFVATQVLLDRSVQASWAITHQGAVVGGLNIRFQFNNRLGELGYSTHREVWGRGFATEAVRAVVDQAFSLHSDLNRIRAMTDPRNVASQRVLLKARFVREGVLRQNRIIRDEPIDEVWFGILRAEWSS